MSMLKRYLLQIGSWVYRHTLFELKKISVQKKTNSVFVQGVYFRNVEFEGRIFLGKETYVTNSYVGYGTIIHNYSFVSETQIGRYCSIAPGIKIIIGQHPVKERFVSTHSAFFSSRDYLGYTFRNEKVFDEQKYIDEENKYQVIIGNDVWMASDVRILAGVTIGDGAVIGACSLVTKDVEPYGIYVGVPAKRIGYRFEPEIIEKLERIKWWNRDEAWLREHVKDFDDVDLFVAKYYRDDDIPGE